jgi:hypothetical protein
MMNKGQQGDMLNLLKTLADEQRLTMITLMHNTERTVGEMAELLNLSEPTISHHIGKLHNTGLLHLRMAGTQRFYRLNEKRLAVFKAYVAEIELTPIPYEDEHSENSWIDALDWAAADKKVLYDYTFNGKLRHLPSKEKKWVVVLRWLATKFEPDVRYTEKEVNAKIMEIHADYATLRRYLIDYGFMRRERGGGNYWLAPEDEPVQKEQNNG